MVDEEEVIQVSSYINLYLSGGGLALVIVAFFAVSFIMGMDTALPDAFGALGDKTILTLHSDFRQRDLLPLPKFLSGNFTRVQAVSRVLCRRALRKQHTLDWAYAGIDAINPLGGCADALASPSPPLASQVACDYILDAYSRVGPPPPECISEGALRELLGSSRVYHSDRSDIQSYDRHLVSWPVVGSRPVSLLDALPAATRLGLNDWETHLLDSAENATLKRAELVAGRPYYHLEFFRTIQFYGTFVTELADRGMRRFRLRDPTDLDAALDTSLGRKKKGTFRINLDTRYFNCGFGAPPSTELPSAPSPQSIEVMRDDTALIAYAELSNDCYVLDVPDSLGPRFTIPSLQARFGGVSTINGAAISPLAFVEPYVITLPIGWNGALHLCQMCVSQVVERYVGLDHIVLDRHPNVSIAGGHHAGAAYLDNFCVISTSRDVADTLIVGIVADSTEIGLWVHEINHASEHATSVGLELDNNRVSLKTSRLCGLRLSIDDIVRGRHCSGALFDIVLGHATSTLMLRREGLAVLDKVYQHIRDFGDALGVLSHNAVTEPLQLSSRLPLFTAKISAPCSSQVPCSYASPFGLGVCSRMLPVDVVCDIWRSSEKCGLTALTMCAFIFGMSALTRPPRATTARTPAGLKPFLPSLSRTSPASPPSALHAPTGWQQTIPTGERPPSPPVCSAAIVATIIHSGDLEFGGRWSMHCATYMRPGGVDILKVQDIILPLRAAGLRSRHPVILLHRHEDLPGKTGIRDEAIFLDQSFDLAALHGKDRHEAKAGAIDDDDKDKDVNAAGPGDPLWQGLHGNDDAGCTLECPNPHRRCPKCHVRKRMFFTCADCESIACVDACLVMIDDAPYCRDCA